MLSSATMRAYPISMTLPVDGVGRMILFDSYPAADCIFQEIWGREVFLFDKNNRMLWQIDPEPGASDDMHRNFDASRNATESFSSINIIDGLYYASRIGGDTFQVNMTNGFATYSGWART